MVFVCLVVFVSYQLVSAETLPGARAQFEIVGISGDEGQAIAEIQRIAEARHVNIYRVQPGLDDGVSQLTMHTFIGDPVAHAQHVEPEYRSFVASQHPTLIDADSLSEQEILGQYATSAVPEQLSTMLGTLGESGIRTEVRSVSPLQAFLFALMQTASAPILVALMLALGLSVIMNVTQNRRAAAIAQLHGASHLDTAWAELSELAKWIAVTLLGIALLGVSALYVYNRLNEFWIFMGWVATSLVVLLSGVIALYGLALMLLSRTRLRPALAGKQPMRMLAATAGVAHVLSVVLVYSVLTVSVSSATVLAADTSQLEPWKRERQAVTLLLNGYLLELENQATMSPELRQMYRDFLATYNTLDARGEVVLSKHPRTIRADPQDGASPYNPHDGNSLMVNNNYLKNHPVVDVDGNVVTRLNEIEHGIHLLIPESAKEHTERIISEYETLNGLHSWEIGADKTEVAPPPLTVSVTYTKTGQDMFNYGQALDMRQWMQHDPVIAVVSPQSELYQGWVLLGTDANSGHVIFSSESALREASEGTALFDYIGSINSPSAEAMRALAERQTQFAVLVTGTLVAIMVFVLSLGILAALYCERHRREHFLQYIHGRSFIKSHGYNLGVTTGVSAIVMLVVTTTLSELSNTPLTVTLVIGSAMLVMSIASTAFAVRLSTRRFRQHDLQRT